MQRAFVVAPPFPGWGRWVLLGSTAALGSADFCEKVIGFEILRLFMPPCICNTVLSCPSGSIVFIDFVRGLHHDRPHHRPRPASGHQPAPLH